MEISGNNAKTRLDFGRWRNGRVVVVDNLDRTYEMRKQSDKFMLPKLSNMVEPY